MLHGKRLKRVAGVDDDTDPPVCELTLRLCETGRLINANDRLVNLLYICHRGINQASVCLSRGLAPEETP